MSDYIDLNLNIDAITLAKFQEQPTNFVFLP